MKQTVYILPETSDTTLYLCLTGTITADDYIKYFDEPVKRIADTNGWYNLYVLYDADFEGWSAEAADLSFKCITAYGPKARYLAYVNAPDSRMLLMKMMGPMMRAETRFFDEDQQQAAKDWLKSTLSA